MTTTPTSTTAVTLLCAGALTALLTACSPSDSGTGGPGPADAPATEASPNTSPADAPASAPVGGPATEVGPADPLQRPGDDRIVGKDWQVIAIYTAPGAPSALPDAIGNPPHLVFGESTALGSTGCANFVARVSFYKGQERVSIREADSLRIDEINFDSRPTPGQPGSGPTDSESSGGGPTDTKSSGNGPTGNVASCEAGQAWAHNHLSRLFIPGARFNISLDPNNQLILTLRDGRVDSPAIRFAAL